MAGATSASTAETNAADYFSITRTAAIGLCLATVSVFIVTWLLIAYINGD
jgi:hypothetical protein